MNEPSSRDLLGYMLGALDSDEHRQIEDQIELDPEFKEELHELRSQVALLDDLEPPGPPPAGLARRTCEYIAALPGTRFESSGPAPQPKSDLARKSRRRWFTENSSETNGLGRKSVMNFVMVAVVLMLMAAIALPVLNNSRFNTRVLACQDNLRTVGMGLLEHADNSGGKYISMPAEGNLAFAGVYAPKLLEAGYVEDASAFMCAGVNNAIGREIPTIDELLEADKYSLVARQKKAGGDFAYIMGQLKNGVYDTGSNQNRPGYIVLADNPSVKLPGRGSNNHGGYGQNVFFEDGRIQFLEAPEFNGDAIYENDWGGVGPGAHPDDIVLVPSGTRLTGFNVQ